MLDEERIKKIREECKSMKKEVLIEYLIRYMIMMDAYENVIKLHYDSLGKDDNHESNN